MLHFTLAVKDAEAFDDVRRRARDMGLPIREGRMLASARPALRAFCVRDPDNHWIEITEEPSR
jgi:catechol 2,3-dioxygenase-like lactoylglutathione lyase family enzyme